MLRMLWTLPGVGGNAMMRLVALGVSTTMELSEGSKIAQSCSATRTFRTRELLLGTFSFSAGKTTTEALFCSLSESSGELSKDSK